MNKKRTVFAFIILIVILGGSLYFNFRSVNRDFASPDLESTDLQPEESMTQEDVTKLNTEQLQKLPEYDMIRESVLQGTEEISQVLSDFLEAYYTASTHGVGYIDPQEVYSAYSQYLTKSAKEEMRPSTAGGEDLESFEYWSEVQKTKIYYDDYTKKSCKVLAIVLMESQMGDLKVHQELKIINLKLRNEDGKWLVHEMLEAQDVNFRESMTNLFG